MQLFDFVLKMTYWVITDRRGKYWSTRDQDWMGFTRATLYDSEGKAEMVLSSVKFNLKNDMEIHDPTVQKIKVEIE